MSDWFEFWQHDPEADPLGFHGSPILIADISDPAAPRALGGQRIDDEIIDTRLIDDVLYAVSKRNPNYWRDDTADGDDHNGIGSLNVADPQDFRAPTFPAHSLG
ncbi:MAG: beta-propeller domain-containing protein [Myxococcota bacterium]|nr:beta-propeller domain-containing protein [Myxococcota bacterium]